MIVGQGSEVVVELEYLLPVIKVGGDEMILRGSRHRAIGRTLLGERVLVRRSYIGLQAVRGTALPSHSGDESTLHMRGCREVLRLTL